MKRCNVFGSEYLSVQIIFTESVEKSGLYFKLPFPHLSLSLFCNEISIKFGVQVAKIMVFHFHAKGTATEMSDLNELKRGRSLFVVSKPEQEEMILRAFHSTVRRKSDIEKIAIDLASCRWRQI